MAYSLNFDGCIFTISDNDNNLIKQYDLANIELFFDDQFFTIKDIDTDWKLHLSELADVDSGAYSTFQDMYDVIHLQRETCRCDCTSGGGGGGGTTGLGYYGAWQTDTTQTASASDTGYAMRFENADITPNGISIANDLSGNPTRITFANTGIYNIQFSSQFQNSDTQLNDVTIWLRLNGVDVLGSAGFVSIPNKHGGIDGHCIVSWNYVIEAIAGQYYELIWSTTNHTNVKMQFYAAGSPPPSAASVILTITQQSGIMSGTGITALNLLTGSSQTITTGTSGTNFNIASLGTTHTFNLPTASATNRGALSSADWTTFNNKLSSSRTISTTSPLSGGGDLTADRTLSIADAVADGTTKGASTFTASDFNSASGVISIDYTNGQSASASNKGFLTSADWSTFNGKQNALGYTPANIAGDTFTGSITATNLSGTNTGNETTSTIGSLINGATSATPNDTDLVATAESSVLKNITWTNVKAFLKTYFDTIYQSSLGYTAENNANKSSSYTASSTTTYANTKALVDGLATRVALVVKSVADGTNVTGTTTETLSASLLIPANTYTTGDIIRITCFAEFTGTAGTKITRIYNNTSASLSGANLLATSTTASSASRSIGMDLLMAIKSSTNTRVKGVTGVSYGSATNNSVATASININWTINQYIIFPIQLGAGADSGFNSFAIIEKL